MLRFYRSLIASLLLWFSLGGPALAAALVLSPEQPRLELDGHLAVLRDASGELDLAAVQSPAWAGRFQTIPASFNGGFTHQGAWWLRFTVEAEAVGSRWLLLKAPFVDRLDVYLPGQDAQARPGVVHRLSGNGQPLSSRDLAVTGFGFQADLQPGGNTFWLRLEGVKTLNLSASLWQLPALTAYLNQQNALFALLLGIALLMSVIGLIFGVWLKDRAFVWYAAYVLASSLLFMANDGFIAVYLLPEQPWLASQLASLAVAASVALGPRMIEVIFELPCHYPVTTRLLRAISILALLTVPVILAGRYDLVVVLLNSLGLLGTVIMVLVSLRLLIRGRFRYALPYFLGFALYGLALALFIGKNLGWVPATDAVHLGYQLFSVAHMAAIAFGLALRVRDIEQEREQLREAALEASREVEQMLERKVGERTRALHGEIDERRQVERRLYETLREQRHLLAMVSHEFRTPLGIISLSAQTLIDLPPDPERTSREAARILRANQRLSGLIDTCLADEWLESAHMQLKPRSFDLGPWLAEFCAEQSQASGREIRLERLSWPLPVAADGNLLPIIFGNLLGNAIKYSPAGSPVCLRAWQEQDQLKITVADQGPGIAPAERELVFEKYYRSPKVLSKAGVGLGLHLVRRIAELHGGKVLVQERAAGGALFLVSLPVCTRFAQGEQGLQEAASL